jgi:hypothetical protein
MSILSNRAIFSSVLLAGLLPLNLQAISFELGDGDTSVRRGKQNQAEVQSLSCQYGRGSHVVNAAKANAAKQIADFMGSYSVGSEALSSHLTDSSFDETHITRLIEANAKHIQGVSYHAPFIQGDEMCVKASLVLKDRAGQRHNSADRISGEIGDADLVTVQVTGEGFEDHNKSITARKAAENDALAKAVQQVVGMVINAGYMEQSTMNTRFVNDDSTMQYAEATASFISTQARGHVKTWKEINYRDIGKRKGRITIEALVVRGKIQDSIDDVMRSMGSPAIFVESKSDALTETLTTIITEFGAEITTDKRYATLILAAEAKGNQRVTGYQADIDIKLKERGGAIFGKWSNEPSLLNWPDSSLEALKELVNIHLEVPEVQAQIRKTLIEATLQIAKKGGPLRTVFIPKRLKANTVKLERALRGVGGVEVQSIRSTAAGVDINLRYMGSDSALASHLQTPLLGVLPGNMHRHHLKVSGNSQITIL